MGTGYTAKKMNNRITLELVILANCNVMSCLFTLLLYSPHSKQHDWDCFSGQSESLHLDLYKLSGKEQMMNSMKQESP